MKYLMNIDLNKNQLLQARVENLAADPLNAVSGQIYFNTVSKAFKVYDGTNWISLGSGTGDVTGPSVSVDSEVVVFDGTTGKAIKSSGFTIATSVPADAVFTDTTYDVVSTTVAGLLKAFSNDNKSASAFGSDDYVWDASTGDYRKLPATAFSDTTYSQATDQTLGLVKLYTSLGTNTDGTMSQSAIKTAIESIEAGTKAMVFKGTVGTGGTVQSLPTTGVKIGDTYIVVSAGTYASQSAKIGDMFIATATTPTWAYVPSGDDGSVNKYTTTITGDGTTTTFTITHNLGQEVEVSVYDNNDELCAVGVTATSSTQCTLTITPALADEVEYTVVVLG